MANQSKLNDDLAQNHNFYQTSKNNSCQSTQTRTRKSPKVHKNLVIPSREYYEAPMDINPGKACSELVSKESSSSAQTQHKEFSDFVKRKSDTASKSEINKFNKSDICHKNFLLEKTAFEAKKQISFVKPKTDIKLRLEYQHFNVKRMTAKPKATMFKGPAQKDIWKTVVVKPTPFKKPKQNEMIPSAPGSNTTSGRSSGIESHKGTRSFQKVQVTEKRLPGLLPEHVQTLVSDEEYLARFLTAFTEESGVTNLFREYLAWVDKAGFEHILDKIGSQSTRNLFKVSLIYERMSFYICYYIYARDIRREEIIFLKKTTVHMYLNFIALVQDLHSQIPEVT